MNDYKKLLNSDLITESFGRKDYLSRLLLQLARIHFSYRCSMTECVKGNFRHKREYTLEMWQCSECGEQDTNIHLKTCIEYEHLRRGIDLEDDYQ